MKQVSSFDKCANVRREKKYVVDINEGEKQQQINIYMLSTQPIWR